MTRKVAKVGVQPADDRAWPATTSQANSLRSHVAAARSHDPLSGQADRQRKRESLDVVVHCMSVPAEV